MRRLFIAVVLNSAVALSGCSLLTVHGPDTRDMACTTDNLAPTFDFLYGGTAALQALQLGMVAVDERQEQMVGGVAVTALVAGIYIYSGIDGMQTTSRCREHINTEFDRLREPSPSEPRDRDDGGWGRPE